jgi:8-oxo-dGTP pyrophosphatase MutT (NUDIX family)
MGHDVALLLLVDRERRILLQHRTADAPVLPGHWAFFGGQVEPGESVEAALRREALEELGHAPRGATLVAAVPFAEGGRVGTLHVFVERFAGDKSRLELREGQGWGWFTVGEMEGLEMIERDRLIARRADGALAGEPAP